MRSRQVDNIELNYGRERKSLVDHLQQVPTGDLLQVGGDKDRNPSLPVPTVVTATTVTTLGSLGDRVLSGTFT